MRRLRGAGLAFAALISFDGTRTSFLRARQVRGRREGCGVGGVARGVVVGQPGARSRRGGAGGRRALLVVGAATACGRGIQTFPRPKRSPSWFQGKIRRRIVMRRIEPAI